MVYTSRGRRAGLCNGEWEHQGEERTQGRSPEAPGTLCLSLGLCGSQQRCGCRSREIEALHGRAKPSVGDLPVSRDCSALWEGEGDREPDISVSKAQKKLKPWGVFWGRRCAEGADRSPSLGTPLLLTRPISLQGVLPGMKMTFLLCKPFQWACVWACTNISRAPLSCQVLGPDGLASTFC